MRLLLLLLLLLLVVLRLLLVLLVLVLLVVVLPLPLLAVPATPGPLQRQLLRTRRLLGVKDAPVSCCIQGLGRLRLVCSCSCEWFDLPVTLVHDSQQLASTSAVVDQLPVALLPLLCLVVQVVQVKFLIPLLLVLTLPLCLLLQLLLLLWQELPGRLAPALPLPRLLLWVPGRADGRMLCTLVAPPCRAPATKPLLRPQLLAGAADWQRSSVSQHGCCSICTDALGTEDWTWPLDPVRNGGPEQVWLGPSSCSCRRATCRRGWCGASCCRRGGCTPCGCGCIPWAAASLRRYTSSSGVAASRASSVWLGRLRWQQQVCPLPLAAAARCARVPS
jgi:hypothetical protein